MSNPASFALYPPSLAMSANPNSNPKTQASDSLQSKPASHRPRRIWVMTSVPLAFTVIILALMNTGSFGAASSDKQDAPATLRQSIVTTEARVRELGITLLEIAHPDGICDVPAEAILNDRIGTFVFVEDFDRKHSFLLARVDVEPGDAGRVRIIRGLFPGDKIVVKGAARLRFEPDAIPKGPETNCF